jgi:hypothetical protein
MKSPTEICHGFTDEDWKALRKDLMGPGGVTKDENAWARAVDVFANRIRERFLSCIEALDDPKSSTGRLIVAGFAIMALCCLLIETLQSFRKEPPSLPSVKGPCSYPTGPCIFPRTTTTGLFKDFLQLPAFGGAFDKNEIAKSFIQGIRNGILHEAETRRWVIWRNKPKFRILMPYNDGYALNRTEFYKAMKSEFESYLQELIKSTNKDLRRRFVKKMDDIVKEC